jgi:hypothetical protein
LRDAAALREALASIAEGREERTAVEIEDVEVLDGGNMVMRCRGGDRVVWVPSLGKLPGTEIERQGDRGRLVLSHDLAVDLGLA